MEISAWVDGELEAEGSILELVDHVAACPECNAFYRQVRALGAEVAMADPRQTEPPAALWAEIAASELRPTLATGARRWPTRGWSAVAALLAATLVWWLVAYRFSSDLVPAPTIAEGRPIPQEIVLGGEADTMTDERFVALATELLQADPRYRHELQSILYQIASQAPKAEDGSVDRSWPNEAGVFSEIFRSPGTSNEWRSATF